MENNKRGNEIFLGVIGVATLIVAIIGATFAFFSASANSNTDAINTSSTSLSLGYSDTITGLKTNLIPAYDSIALIGSKETGTITAENPKGNAECIDDNGNEICSIYEFTVGNPSTTTAQKIFGSIEIVTNHFENLYFRIYDITDSETGVEVVTPTKFLATGSQSLSQLTTTLNPSPAGAVSETSYDATKPETYGENTVEDKITNIKKYRMIIWIRETGTVQSGGTAGANDGKDDSKIFTAGIKFTTTSGTSGVTGVIGAATGTNAD